MWEKVFSILQVVIGAALGSALGAWLTHDIQIRELELKQVEQIDKYVTMVTDTEKPALRRDIALFFSEVSISKEMRNGWKRYLTVVEANLAALAKLEEAKQAEIKKVEKEVQATPASTDKLVQLSALREQREQIAASLTVHIRDESQREQAAALAEALYRDNYLVPGIQLVPVGPRQSELRFFRKAEQDTASELANRLNADLPKDSARIDVKYIPGHEASKQIRTNHFELWLAVESAR
jgi:hypothetical protein